MNELISFHLSDIVPPYFSHLSPLYFLSNLQTTRNTNIPTTKSSFTRRVTPRDSSSPHTGNTIFDSPFIRGKGANLRSDGYA